MRARLTEGTATESLTAMPLWILLATPVPIAVALALFWLQMHR
jgi:hypothetical protein